MFLKSRTRSFGVFIPIQIRNRYGNWVVHLKEIDKVFYDLDSKVTADDVRRALIEHDGFSHKIEVIEEW